MTCVSRFDVARSRVSHQRNAELARLLQVLWVKIWHGICAVHAIENGASWWHWFFGCRNHDELQLNLECWRKLALEEFKLRQLLVQSSRRSLFAPPTVSDQNLKDLIGQLSIDISHMYAYDPSPYLESYAKTIWYRVCEESEHYRREGLPTMPMFELASMLCGEHAGKLPTMNELF